MSILPGFLVCLSVCRQGANKFRCRGGRKQPNALLGSQCRSVLGRNWVCQERGAFAIVNVEDQRLLT